MRVSKVNWLGTLIANIPIGIWIIASLRYIDNIASTAGPEMAIVYAYIAGALAVLLIHYSYKTYNWVTNPFKKRAQSNKK